MKFKISAIGPYTVLGHADKSKLHCMLPDKLHNVLYVTASLCTSYSLITQGGDRLQRVSLIDKAAFAYAGFTQL